jgi:hypothetical protein
LAGSIAGKVDATEDQSDTKPPITSTREVLKTEKVEDDQQRRKKKGNDNAKSADSIKTDEYISFGG